MYSVLETLIIRPRSFAADAALVGLCPGHCGFQLGGGGAMSSVKSRSFNTLAGYRLERRGCVSTPESRSDVVFLIR